MHPLTVYEIAVREHQSTLGERRLEGTVRSRLRSVHEARPSTRGRLLHQPSPADTATATTDGRPAVA